MEYAFIGFAASLTILFFWFWKKKQSLTMRSQATTPDTVPPNVDKPKVETPSWENRIRKGLAKSSQDVWLKLGNLISGKSIDQDLKNQMEEILFSADLGPSLVAELMDVIIKKEHHAITDLASFKKVIFTFLKEKMETIQNTAQAAPLEMSAATKKTGPQVIMVVGINGVGKTTTIGKLATRLQRQGAKVMVGAGDTFRAAAVDQLQVWCDRAGVEMIRAKEGTAPSGVAYEALNQALQKNADYCIIDTAGRLHTKENLMEELKKMKKVLSKLLPDAPHHTLMVIDAITGQNALKQAEEFNKILNLTGIIFTKCDGSAKAGSAVAVVQTLKVPILYIGVGETVDDLNVFSLEEYLAGMLDIDA